MAQSALPSTGIALQITERKQKTPLTLARVEIPALADNEILIENVAVAQAVGDPLCVDYDVLIPTIPFTNGWDCSGAVLGVGKDVKDFKIGDRVACLAHATSARHGSYQQYTIALDILTCKIPATLTHEDASIISLAFGTAIAGVHHLGIPAGGVDAKLPLPPLPDSVAPILVSGGASSVGAIAIQLAKLSGYRVIATASSKNFDYVKSLGAEWVVDYHDGEKAIKEITDISEGKLSVVYNAISSPESRALSLNVFGSQGGRMAVVDPRADLTDTGGRSDINIFYGGGYHVMTNPELQNSFRLLERLLAQNVLVGHPIKVMPGGLSGVDEGWRLQRANEVRAQKLVYRIADTPGLSTL